MLWSKLSSTLVLVSSSSLVLGRACRPSNPCDSDRNPALSALKDLEATDFCVDFLGLETVTISETEIVSNTVAATTTVSVTTTIPFTTTTKTTVLETVTDEESVAGPSVTITTTEKATESVTVTASFTETTTRTTNVVEFVRNAKRAEATRIPLLGRGQRQDAVAERERQLEAHDLASRDISPRVAAAPEGLEGFASEALSTACSCFVGAPSLTAIVTVTAAETVIQTAEDVSTESQAVETVTVSVLTTYTLTETTTLPGITATATVSQTTTISTTVSQTETATAVSTISSSDLYTRQFSGQGCVYNRYTNYDLVQEAFTTTERMFQVCAGRCASLGSGCKSFFAYQDMDYPYIWCIIDSTYYNPSYLQCNIPFSGANLAYNSPY